MRLLTKFKQKVDKYMSEADERADRRVAKARTATERDKLKAQIARERMATKREVAEARTALLKAETARKNAVKELREVGDGFGEGLADMLGLSTRRKPKRVASRTRRSVAKKKAATKKSRRPSRVEYY